MQRQYLLVSLFLLISASRVLQLRAATQDAQAVDEEPDAVKGSSHLQGEVKNLQRELQAKEKEVSKLLKRVDDLQAEKADAVKRVKALQSASKETDSSAKAELAELKLQLETKQQQLTEHRATCSAAEGQVEEAQKQVDKLTTELGHAKKAYKKLESDSDLNSKQSSKALQDLKKHLAAAERDADDSQSALKEAQASAMETIKQLNDLTSSWLPHWLSHRYEKATRSVRPQLDYAWQKGEEYALLTSTHSTKLYANGKAKALEAWEGASPAAQQAYQTSQRIIVDGYASSKKFAGPHLASAQKHGKRAWLAAKLHLNGLLVHPRVIQLRRQLKAQVAEVEKAIAKQLKSYPALKPYAKQPYLAYITWAALALPLVIILLPFFLFTGKRKVRPAASESTQVLGVVQPEKADTSSTAPGSKPRKAKAAKRIIEGDEGVSYA